MSGGYWLFPYCVNICLFMAADVYAFVPENKKLAVEKEFLPARPGEDVPGTKRDK